MASGIFAVLDDIAALMDDVAVASKIAGRKTAAILGDDLAVNAEKATGFVSSREIPVLWAITKGSFVNKLIIIPFALLLNSFFPSAITYILILGGLYLAYEGAEKIIEFLFHKKDKTKEPEKATKDLENIEDSRKAEDIKIRDAIVTDFILSIEIIIIALSTVKDAELTVQILTVSAIGLMATVGVYGLVAIIVRMDDLGYRLIKKSEGEGLWAKIGKSLVKALPKIVKAFSIIGTIALLMVSGGIFDHNIPFFHHLEFKIPGRLKWNICSLFNHNIDFIHNSKLIFPDTIKQMILGLVIGVLIVPIVHLLKKVFGKDKNVNA